MGKDKVDWLDCKTGKITSKSPQYFFVAKSKFLLQIYILKIKQKWLQLRLQTSHFRGYEYPC